MYGMEDLKADAALHRLANMVPGTEVSEEVYLALKTRVRSLRLPDRTRMNSTQGISEGFLYGSLYCWKGTDRMFLAFGLSRRRGAPRYYYLGLSSIDGADNRRVDFRKAMRDPNYLARMMMKGR